MWRQPATCIPGAPDTGTHSFVGPCCVVAQSFTESSKLKRHMRSHSGERPFECPHPGCGKRFSLDFNMRVHARIHSGERPHACDYPGCGKKFAQAANKKAHMKRHTE